jgi:hypothetical protein
MERQGGRIGRRQIANFKSGDGGAVVWDRIRIKTAAEKYDSGQQYT